jgi:ribosomal protein S18 acetylase RimI-like enzyme
MDLQRIVWARHIWSLPEVTLCSSAPDGYAFGCAGIQNDREIVDVVLTAYASDPIWEPLMEGIRNRMTERIKTTLGTAEADYVVARAGNEIIAVSGVAKEHWTDQNLLTGICVIPRHQRRKIGTYLLNMSLLRLKEMGLVQARVYTESGSLADRKIYPLFGSKRQEGVLYPGVELKGKKS